MESAVPTSHFPPLPKFETFTAVGIDLSDCWLAKMNKENRGHHSDWADDFSPWCRKGWVPRDESDGDLLTFARLQRFPESYARA